MTASKPADPGRAPSAAEPSDAETRGDETRGDETRGASAFRRPSAADLLDAADAAEAEGAPAVTVEALAAEVLRAFAERRAKDAPGANAAIDLDPERVEQDLARLVLALIEFLRRLLEAQALRRMERGRLTEEEEERVGLTLMRARERLVEIAERFGLTEEDLTLDLGAFGRLC